MLLYQGHSYRRATTISSPKEAQQYCRKTAKQAADSLRALSENAVATVEAFNRWVEPLVSWAAQLWQQVGSTTIQRREEQRKLDNLRAKAREISKLAQPLDPAESADRFGIHQAWDRLDRIPRLVDHLVKLTPRVEDYAARPKQVKHGDFQILNRYGYTTEEMAEPLAVLDAATEKIRSAGFDEILYGVILLVDKIPQEHWAGRYTPQNDIIEVVQKVPARFSPVYTLIHEFGHRVWYKFVGEQQQQQYEEAYAAPAAYRLTVEDRQRWWDTLLSLNFDTHRLTSVMSAEESVRLREYWFDRTTAMTRRQLQSGGDEVERQKRIDSVWRYQFVRPQRLLVYPETKGTSVTDYGDTHVKEDFAEIFAHVVLGMPVKPEARQRYDVAVGKKQVVAEMHTAKWEQFDIAAIAADLNRRAFGGKLDLSFPMVYRALKPVYGMVRAVINKATGKAVVKELIVSSRYKMDQKQFEGIVLHELAHVSTFQDGSWYTSYFLDRSGHGTSFRQELDRLKAAGFDCPVSETVGRMEMDVGKELAAPIFAILRDNNDGVVFRAPPTVEELSKYLNDYLAYQAMRSGKEIEAALVRTTNPQVRNCTVSRSLSSAMGKLCEVSPGVRQALDEDEVARVVISPKTFSPQRETAKTLARTLIVAWLSQLGQVHTAAASHSDSYLLNLREATRKFIIAWYGVLYEAHRQSPENDVCLAKQHYHRLSPEQAQAKVLRAAETLRKAISGLIRTQNHPDLAQVMRDADNIVDRGNIGMAGQFCFSIDEVTEMLDRAKYCLSMFDRQIKSERISTMKRTAATDLNKLLTSTAQVMRQHVTVWLALLNEAEQEEGDTVCVSNVEGEFKRWSADAIQDKVQQVVELLYNLLQLWKRSVQRQTAAPVIVSLARELAKFRDLITVTVEKALDAQPDRYCINVAETKKLAEAAKKIQQYSERLIQYVGKQKTAAVQKKASIWARLREAEVKTAAMTDADVHAEVAKIKQVLRMKETRAQRNFQREKDACLAEHSGSMATEQATQLCGMSQAKTALKKKLTSARSEYQQRLDDLRARAGKWANLVPVK